MTSTPQHPPPAGPDPDDVAELTRLLGLMRDFPSDEQRARFLLTSNWLRERGAEAARINAEQLAALGASGVPVPALAALVDCGVCGGTGVMTARAVDADPAAPPAIIPCPACAGTGATIVRPPAGARPVAVTR
jgi:hypothetical protein